MKYIKVLLVVVVILLVGFSIVKNIHPPTPRIPTAGAIVAQLRALGELETARLTVEPNGNRGIVTAGVDLRGVTTKNFATDGTHIQLNLDPPKIFRVQAEANPTAAQEIRKAACAQDILGNASDTAAKKLAAVLKSLGFTGTLVMITEPTLC